MNTAQTYEYLNRISPLKVRKTLFFGDVANINATIKVGYSEFKRRHNDKIDAQPDVWVDGKDKVGKKNKSRKAKAGKLKGNDTTLFKCILNLLWKNMENIRKGNPERYKDLLSSSKHSLPVLTNRVQLMTMTDGEMTSLTTISNSLDRLRDARLILNTRHTSAVKHIILNEKGEEETLITMRPNGRGNFELWINKEIIAWTYDVIELFDKKEKAQNPTVENAGNDGKNPNNNDNTRNFSNTDNQRVTKVKIQKLNQSPNIIIDPFKSINNLGKTQDDGSGILTDTVKNEIPPIGEIIKNGTETGNVEKLHNPQVENSEVADKSTLPILAEEEEAAKIKAERGRKPGRPKRKPSDSAETAPDFPHKNDIPHRQGQKLAYHLWIMSLGTLYPNLTDHYRREHEEFCLNLLRMQLFQLQNRFEISLPNAFRLMKLGLSRVNKWISDDEDNRYAIVPHLYFDFQSPDNQGIKFVDILEKWIIKGELRQLNHQNMARGSKLKAYFAYQKGENMFHKVLKHVDTYGWEKVLKNYSEGKYFEELTRYFNKESIPESTRKTVLDRFNLDMVGLLKGGEKFASFKLEYDGVHYLRNFFKNK